LIRRSDPVADGLARQIFFRPDHYDGQLEFIKIGNQTVSPLLIGKNKLGLAVLETVSQLRPSHQALKGTARRPIAVEAMKARQNSG